MSQSLLDLIKAYGDANRVPEALAKVEERIDAIEDAAIQIGVDGETISALLDGRE